MFDRFRFGAKRDSPAALDASQPKRAKREEEGAEVSTAGEEADGAAAESEDAAAAVKWRERWRAVCTQCFERCQPCEHFPERRLRLLIVGHNPSDHAWTSGYSYSNPSNRMWGLLSGSLPPLTWTGVVSAGAAIATQNQLPDWIGVGFTSIGLEPGNDAAKYGKAIMSRWRDDFFRRLRLHAKRVCEAQHSRMKNDSEENQRCEQPHAPMIIAFSGKRQFTWLFTPPLAKLESFGKQTKLPSLWPRELVADSEVWVLPSSSGRAAMTTEQRVRPYQQLAERFHQLSWGESETPSSIVVVKRELSLPTSE